MRGGTTVGCDAVPGVGVATGAGAAGCIKVASKLPRLWSMFPALCGGTLTSIMGSTRKEMRLAAETTGNGAAGLAAAVTGDCPSKDCSDGVWPSSVCKVGTSAGPTSQPFDLGLSFLLAALWAAGSSTLASPPRGLLQSAEVSRERERPFFLLGLLLLAIVLEFLPGE